MRESIFENTRNAMRAGKFALMRPVMTSTLGRWVAIRRWMPAARAICARRVIDSSTSFFATSIRSASSSMTITMYGRWPWSSFSFSSFCASALGSPSIGSLTVDWSTSSFCRSSRIFGMRLL